MPFYERIPGSDPAADTRDATHGRASESNDCNGSTVRPIKDKQAVNVSKLNLIYHCQFNCRLLVASKLANKLCAPWMPSKVEISPLYDRSIIEMNTRKGSHQGSSG